MVFHGGVWIMWCIPLTTPKQKLSTKEACFNQRVSLFFWHVIDSFKCTNGQNLSKKSSCVSRNFILTMLNGITRKTCHIIVLQANQIWLTEKFKTTCQGQCNATFSSNEHTGTSFSPTFTQVKAMFNIIMLSNWTKNNVKKELNLHLSHTVTSETAH